MVQPVRTRRKNRFNFLKEAPSLESFDEYPMLRPEVDPQVHVSRNSVDQPFYLVCEKDTVLAQFSGAARVDFQQGAVRWFDLVPGDYVYVPGGVPHRVLVTEPGEQIRYKASQPGAESVVWYCDSCEAELDRHDFDAQAAPAQAGWLAGADRHNAEDARRTCRACGAAHPPIDLAPFRWAAIVDALTASEDDA